MPKCRECGANIKWVEMEGGAKMPVNQEKETRIYVDPKTHKGRTLTFYTPHWSTCSKPDAFRSKSARTPDWF